MKYFVTGIDTDSGKTLACAILCEALNADYWKPIQAGLPRDTDTVKELLERTDIRFHSERFLLNTPASPHAAAKIDGLKIRLDDFALPDDNRSLIVEGAGGCLVPINDQHFVIDIAIRLSLPVIVVADLYLGSINHTLLTLEALRTRNVHVKGIIFNGEPNAESEKIILHHSKLNVMLHIRKEAVINNSVVKRYVAQFKNVE